MGEGEVWGGGGRGVRWGGGERVGKGRGEGGGAEMPATVCREGKVLLKAEGASGRKTGIMFPVRREG